MAQTSTENYVLTTTMLKEDGQSSIQAVQYFNGLGYPTVSAGVVGGSGQTAYSLTKYDALGREECKYVPVSTDYSILYKDANTVSNNVKNKYNDSQAYSKTQYDALDRPISVTTAGSAFSGKPTKIEYSANSASEVIRYGVSKDMLTKDSSNPFYPANKLTKETTTDPDGKKVETFKDLSGNIIMQRVNGSLCTYYVYDNLGRLRFVLPPKYQSEKNIDKTCYKYRYDDRGRLVAKTLPGCDSIRYWYDNADRMICMRDPQLRAAGKYRFFIYDKFDRMVVQGVCTACSVYGVVRNATFSTSTAGVLGTSYEMPSDYVSALKDAELEIANYYDKNQEKIYGNKKTYFSSIKPSTSVSQIGRLTGTLVAASNGEFIAQVMVYDIKGNVTVSNSREIGGRTVSNTNKYTFTNNLLTSDTYVNVKYGNAFAIGEAYGYSDKIDKKWAYIISVNHGTQEKATFSYNYDELGRSSRISRNNLPSDKDRYVYYNYDMRGWLKEIKTDRFTEELFYADGPGTKYYNGNISSIRWKDNTSSVKRGYMFVYDGANRMRAAAYGEGENLTSNPNRYNEEIKYDENGNIIRVIRNGKTSSGYGRIDDLTITYNGNQPSSVSEAAADYDYTGSFEYKKAKGTGYKFNTSGSLIADKSRGIAYITYDLNNNPQQIYFTNGNVTKYVYSASGQKLRAVHYTAKPNITRTWGKKPAELTSAQILLVDSTDYLLGGRLVMKNGKIDKVLFDGGYAQASVASATTDKFAFYYYNQDHLGNNREVVDASGAVTQVTNYYPFGAPYADATASKGADLQPYKYNGKELDLMHGLNTYDYGARQHDPILARWDRMDPLCEKYYNVSPYNYCHNNPVMMVDPDGMDDYYTPDGTYLGTNSAETDNIYIANNYRQSLEGNIIDSSIALQDYKDLSADAYSKIFTNSLALGGYNTTELADGKIHVVTYDLVGGRDMPKEASDVGLSDETVNGQIVALAATRRDHSNGAFITAYVQQGQEEGYLFSTRSNIISVLWDHEFKGHYKYPFQHKEDGFTDTVFFMQMQSPTWQKTTADFKNYHNKILSDNGWW